MTSAPNENVHTSTIAGAPEIVLTARSIFCAGWSVAQAQAIPSMTRQTTASRMKAHSGFRLRIAWSDMRRRVASVLPTGWDTSASARERPVCGHGPS